MESLFKIGTKVRFRYTGETGTISAFLDSNMIAVRMDDDHDMEIPAFEEDLQPVEVVFTPPPNPFAPKKKTSESPKAPERRVIRADQPVGDPLGLQMCFEPMAGRDGTVTRYKAWLLNDTKFDFIVDVGLFIGDETLFRVEDFSNACSAVELGEMLADDLNDYPEIDAVVQRITTAGTDTAMERILKIKPKVFFNRLQHVAVLQMPVHQFILFDRFEKPESDQAEQQDLKAYTKQHAKKNTKANTQQAHRPYQLYNPDEFAAFEPEIDLHIEKLVDNWQKLSKADILRIQLHYFHRYMERAVRLGVPSVFVIHGVGEGKLRSAIAEELRRHPYVRRYKNQYHKKYGYGATEVWF